MLSQLRDRLQKGIEDEEWKARKNMVWRGAYSDKTRRSDWGLRDGVDDAIIALVVMCWARSSDTEIGVCFLRELGLPSCASFPWDDQIMTLRQSIEAAERGGYRCSRCFDTGKWLKLGNGCCGAKHCTDIVNAKVKACGCQSSNELP